MTTANLSKWEIFFHIGYHRTGTTFLQRVVFPDCADRICLATPTRLSNISHFLLQTAAPDLSPSAFARQLPAGARHRKLLVSHESLSGDLETDDLETAKRLHGVAPNAKIIIGIRSQFTAIPSLYPIYLKSGGRERYRQYLETLLEGGKFDYLPLVQRYRELFDSSGVLVLLFEQLRHRPMDFLADLGNFLGLPENTGSVDISKHHNRRYPVLAASVIRPLNVALRNEVLGRMVGHKAAAVVRGSLMKRLRMGSEFLSRLGLPSRDSVYEEDEEARRLITQRHQSANERLSRLLEMDLASYGYPAAQ